MKTTTTEDTKATATQQIETIVPSIAIKAYKAEEKQLLGIPKDQLLPLRYTAAEATSRGLWLGQNAERDLQLFRACYRKPPEAEIRTMVSRALAVKGAEDIMLDPPDEQEASRTPDFDSARDLKGRHIKIVSAVAHDKPEIQKKLEAILPGRGHQDLGSDLIDLVKLEQNHWESFGPTGLASFEELREMEALGIRILRWTARRNRKERKLSVRAAEQRAWTHMAQAYLKIRAYAYVLFLDDLDKWRRDYPSLFAVISPRGRGDKPKDDTVERFEEAAAPAEPAEPIEPDEGFEAPE